MSDMIPIEDAPASVQKAFRRNQLKRSSVLTTDPYKLVEEFGVNSEWCGMCGGFSISCSCPAPPSNEKAAHKLIAAAFPPWTN